MNDLKALAQVFVGAAATLPRDAAVDVVHDALVSFERELVAMVGAEAKTVADGLHALSAALSGVVRTKGPLIPIMMELVALEDEVRSSELVGFRRALKKLDAARELPREHAAEVR